MTARHETRQRIGGGTLEPRILLAVFCVLSLVSSAVYAQKGIGDQTGVVRQGLRPPLTRLSGKVLSVETHPCEKTTGPAVAGTHLIVEGADGRKYNLHLGPADAVASITKLLRPGGQVEAVAFRTSKMPEDQYVVSTLRLEDNRILRLRGSDLRPFWSRRSQLGGGWNQGFTGCGKGRALGFQAQRQSGRHFGSRRGLHRSSCRRIF